MIGDNLALVALVTILWMLQLPTRGSGQPSNQISSLNADCIPVNFTSNTSGFLFSHASHGSAPYPPNMACSWSFPSRLGHWINVTVAGLQLSAGDCLILRGKTGSGTQLNATYCGTVTKSVEFFVIMEYVELKFQSDSSNESSGFLVHYEYFDFCGTLYAWKTDSGHLLGPRRNSPTRNGTQCSWLLSVSSNKRIVAWFTDLNLESGDSVILYDGSKVGQRVIEPLGSSVYRLNQGYIASSNVLSVRATFGFNSGVKNRFMIQYGIVDTAPATVCPAVATFSNQTGFIVSHIGFGVRVYPDNINCTWLIDAPSETQIIFWFSSFTTESTVDVVSVYDTEAESLIVNKLSGAVKNPIIYQTYSQSIRVHFVSDRSLGGIGFKMEFNFTSINTTGFRNLSAGSGEITSHSGVGFSPYPRNANLFWQLNAPLGNSVAASLTYLRMASSSYNITIYDGAIRSKVIGVFYDIANENITIVSTGNIMTVHFRTASNSKKSHGFRLQHRAISNPGKQECQAISSFSDTKGEILSHASYGITPYPPNMRCTWTLPIRYEYVIRINISSVKLASGDCFNVTGLSPTDKSVCDFTSVEPVSTYAHESVQFSFTSNTNYESLGFKISFEYLHACGQQITSRPNTGEIVSPPGGAPMILNKNLNCSWLINVSPEMQVAVWFTYLTLNNHSDTITLYDGDSSGLAIATINGAVGSFYSVNQGFTSSRNVMRVNFTHLASGGAFGFRLQYSPADNATVCSAVINGSSVGGYIVSHLGYGSISYSNNMNCTWRIDAPAGCQIAFEFDSFDIHNRLDTISAKDVGLDVEIFQDYLYDRPKLLRLNVSLTNAVQLNFLTNFYGTASGFKLRYWFIKTACASFQNITASSGEIVSHSGVGSFAHPRGLNCYWQINTAPGRRIVLSSNYQVFDGELRFIDGVNGSASINARGKSNGEDKLRLFVSSSNVLTVHFRSPANATGYAILAKGFKVQYRTVENPPNRECAPIKYTSKTTGVIVSHSTYGSTPYPANTNCSWMLPYRPEYPVVRLKVDFQLASGDCLNVTKDGGLDRFFKFCDWRDDSFITVSERGYIKLAFTSDISFESIGFTADFVYSDYCGTVQRWSANRGVIESPPGPHDMIFYQDDAQCSWLITASPGKQVVAWFTRFKVDDYNDSVTIYDGVNRTVRLVTARGGLDPQNQGYIASSNAMLVDFRTDKKGVGYGFSLEYSTSDNISGNICPAIINATELGGTVISHIGFGKTNHTRMTSCSWTIQVPSGMLITYWFTHWNINSCCEWVSVSDSHLQTTFERSETIYSNPNRVYKSSSSLINVVFRSDGTNVTGGFRLQYNFTRFSCHGFENITALSGEIESHKGVGTYLYPSKVNCYWQLNAPVGKRVVVNFTFLKMASSSDSVTLYDGVNKSSIIGSFFKMEKENMTVVSSSNILTVFFHTEGYRYEYGTGFRLQHSVAESSNRTQCSPLNMSLNSTKVISNHPNYGALLYPPNTKCAWSLSAKSGYLVYLQASDIKLGKGDCLSIKVFNESSSYCSWDAASSFSTVLGDRAELIFTSDSLYESFGFIAYLKLYNYCGIFKNLTAESGRITRQPIDVAATPRSGKILQCSWVIQVPPGNRIVVTFNRVLYNLEVLTMYDDVNVTNLTRRAEYNYSSYLLYNRYVSFSNVMRIDFRFDISRIDLELVLDYKTERKFCGDHLNESAETGTIPSHPGAGKRLRYVNNMQCSWLIKVPIGKKVYVWFTSLHLNNSNDFVTMYDGSDSSVPIATVRGGSDHPQEQDYSSSSNSMRVNFSTDANGVSLGFILMFNTLSKHDTFCPPVFNASEDGGILISHHGFGSVEYLDNVKCRWRIDAPPGMQIVFWFSFFNTEGRFDTVTVTDMGTNSDLVTDLSGGFGAVDSPRVYVSRSGSIQITFVTDNGFGKKGFKMEYKFNATSV